MTHNLTIKITSIIILLICLSACSNSHSGTISNDSKNYTDNIGTSKSYSSATEADAKLFDFSDDKTAEITWELIDGVLTISGEGKMPNYMYDSSPWRGYSNEIFSVIVNEGITSIGDSAFMFCDKIESVQLPSTLKVIERVAFNGCEKLREINLPDGLKEIQRSAFATYSYDLKSIYIPASVSKIAEKAFEGCFALSSIEVDKNNLWYCTDDIGVLYTKDMSILLEFPDALEVDEYIISDKTKEIADGAIFTKNLKNIYVPNSVIKIGDESFADSKKLVIYADADSVAAKYAEDKNLKYRIVDDNGNIVAKNKLKNTIWNDNCVIDEIGWIEEDGSVEALKNRMKYFFDACGIQPYVYFVNNQHGLLTDEDKTNFAAKFYDEQIANSYTFVYFYFEEPVSDDLGYMYYECGKDATEIMNEGVIDEFWNIVDQEWYSSKTTEDCLASIFVRTADYITEN